MSRFADAAYEWLLKYAPGRPVTTDELSAGLVAARPDLATASENRKTPRNTLMRDIRLDKAGRFRVAERRVALVDVDARKT